MRVQELLQVQQRAGVPGAEARGEGDGRSDGARRHVRVGAPPHAEPRRCAGAVSAVHPLIDGPPRLTLVDPRHCAATSAVHLVIDDADDDRCNCYFKTIKLLISSFFFLFFPHFSGANSV